MPAELFPLNHGPLYSAIQREDYASAYTFMQQHYYRPMLYGNPFRTIPIFQGITSAQWDAVRAAGNSGGAAAARPERRAPVGLDRPAFLDLPAGPNALARQPMMRYGRASPELGHRPHADSLLTDSSAYNTTYSSASSFPILDNMPRAMNYNIAEPVKESIYRSRVSVQMQNGRTVGVPEFRYGRWDKSIYPGSANHSQPLRGHAGVDLPAGASRGYRLRAAEQAGTGHHHARIEIWPMELPENFIIYM